MAIRKLAAQEVYATSRLHTPCSTQDNLRMALFAKKHNLTIDQVEDMLEKVTIHGNTQTKT